MYRVHIRRGEFEFEAESTDKDFVEGLLKEYTAIISSLPAASTHLQVAPSGASTHPQVTPSGVPSNSQLTSDKKPLSIGEFVKKLGPQSGPEYVITIGYFLEKFENKESFTSADIREGFKKIKFNHPNPADAIGKAKATGRLMDRDDGFMLTRTAEDWIESKLRMPE